MRVITVGTSNITELLIAGFKEVGIEVFACVGRDAEKTKEFAKKNKIARSANDYEKVLMSNSFDTVYLGLPNSLHYEYAKKALLAGKNVIVEKPLATNFKQAKELVSIANANKLMLFDANITPHNLAFKQLKDDLKHIGQIRMVELDYSKYSSKYDKFLKGETPNVFNPEYAGGALMDLGIYNISFSIGLFGLPDFVKYCPNMQRGIDTSGVAILDYGDFKVTSIACKDANRGSLINILGEKGNIVSYQDNNIFNSYQLTLNDGSASEHNFKEVSKYYYELKDFKEMLDNQDFKKNNEYLTKMLMCIRVLDDLRRSANLTFKDDE